MVPKINLIPWRNELRFKKKYYFKMQLLISLGMAGLILLVWCLMLQQEINKATKWANYWQREQSLVIAQSKNNNEIKHQQELLQRVRSQIFNLEQRRTEFGGIFDALHKSLPINSYLTQLIIKNNEVRLLGKTKSISDLKQLIAKLNQIKDYGMASIQKIKRQNDEYDFVLLWFIKY